MLLNSEVSVSPDQQNCFYNVMVVSLLMFYIYVVKVISYINVAGIKSKVLHKDTSFHLRSTYFYTFVVLDAFFFSFKVAVST